MLVEDLESIVILIESIVRNELVKRLHRYKLHLTRRNARATNYEVIDNDIPFYFRISIVILLMIGCRGMKSLPSSHHLCCYDHVPCPLTTVVINHIQARFFVDCIQFRKTTSISSLQQSITSPWPHVGARCIIRNVTNNHVQWNSTKISSLSTLNNTLDLLNEYSMCIKVWFKRDRQRLNNHCIHHAHEQSTTRCVYHN